MRAPGLFVVLGALALAGCASSPAPHPIVAAAPPSTDPSPTAAPPPAAAPAQGAPPTARSPDDERATLGTEDSRHEARQRRRAYGWVALSAGTLAAGVAVTTSFMMLHQASIRSDNCTNKVCSPAGIAANEQLDAMAAWNAGAWVLGAAGLGVGAVLLLTNPSDKGRETQVAVSPSGVLLRGSF
jgi:hypothetical protein